LGIKGLPPAPLAAGRAETPLVITLVTSSMFCCS